MTLIKEMDKLLATDMKRFKSINKQTPTMAYILGFHDAIKNVKRLLK